MKANWDVEWSPRDARLKISIAQVLAGAHRDMPAQPWSSRAMRDPVAGSWRYAATMDFVLSEAPGHQHRKLLKPLDLYI